MANLLLVNHRNPQLVDGDTLRCYKLRQLMDGGCPKVKVECCEVGLENDPRRNPSLREWRFLTVGTDEALAQAADSYGNVESPGRLTPNAYRRKEV